MGKVKLFCFPHAGGSAMIYTKWKKFLQPEIEMIPVEMAGRGRRIDSPLYQSFAEMVDDVFNSVTPQLTGVNYAFFGHSMGSLLAYELTIKLMEQNLQKPIHVFFSGREAPHIKNTKFYHNLPDNKFKDEILKLGGTSEQIFENKELYQIYIPVLKSDLKNHETYQYQEKHLKFDCNISVISGNHDPEVNLEDLPAWKIYTHKNCSINIVEGGHSIITENIETVTNIITQTLCYTPHF